MDIGPCRLLRALTEEEAFETPPWRRTLCPEYEKCLDYAVGRFWVSFTCRGCYMEELILSGKMKELHPPEVSVSKVIYQESPGSNITYH